MSSGEEAAVAPFHGTFTKDILYELHRRQPHRFHFMTKFNAKSASWKDFELVVLDGELRDFARCVHCKNFVSYSSKKGTGSMLRHRCHAKESYFTGDSVEEGVRDKKIITLLRRNNSCKLYGHSCLGGHGKRSDDGSAPGGGVSPDVMQMLRKTADDEALPPFPAQARFDRVALLEKALIQLLRNRMMV